MVICQCANLERFELSTVYFKRGSPRAAGSLLPLVSTNGFKYRRQSLFLCGIYPLSYSYKYLEKGLKPTEESGKTGRFIYPSVETDGKREPAAWGKAPLKRHK